MVKANRSFYLKPYISALKLARAGRHWRSFLLLSFLPRRGDAIWIWYSDLGSMYGLLEYPYILRYPLHGQHCRSDSTVGSFSMLPLTVAVVCFLKHADQHCLRRYGSQPATSHWNYRAVSVPTTHMYFSCSYSAYARPPWSSSFSYRLVIYDFKPVPLSIHSW